MWYAIGIRKDSDGLWSHKQGTFPVERLDDSGVLMIDPENLDLGEYEFVGYYAVSAWDT